MNTKLQVMKAKPKKLRTAKPNAFLNSMSRGGGVDANPGQGGGKPPAMTNPKKGMAGSPMGGNVKKNIA